MENNFQNSGSCRPHYCSICWPPCHFERIGNYLFRDSCLEHLTAFNQIPNHFSRLVFISDVFSTFLYSSSFLQSALSNLPPAFPSLPDTFHILLSSFTPLDLALSIPLVFLPSFLCADLTSALATLLSVV